MRPGFQPLLETNVITLKTVDQDRSTLRCKCVHQGQVGLIGGSGRIQATKPVRRGIRDDEAIGESTIGNLIVIVGVTPAAYAASGIGIPESAVLKI